MLVRRSSLPSLEILYIRAPNSSFPSYGITVFAITSRNSLTPSNLRAEPNNTGKIRLSLKSLRISSNKIVPQLRKLSKSSSSHVAISSLSSSGISKTSVKSMHSYESSFFSEASTLSLSAPSKSILLTKIKVGIFIVLNSCHNVLVWLSTI